MSRLALTTVFLISFTLLGFLAGRFSNGPVGVSPIQQIQQSTTSQSAQSVPTTQSLQAAVNPLFKTQAATFQGKITSVSGKTLQVESEAGQKGEFGVSDKVVIYKFASDSPTASSSSDLKTIDTGKQAIISLELMGGKYQAISISYFRTP